MSTMHIDVVSGEAQIFSGDANFIAVPGEAGELGILPGHTPLLTRIRPGALRIQRDGAAEELIVVAGGILEIQPNSVTVLADTAIRGQDIDETKALAARERAQEALRNAQDKSEIATVQAELATLAAQIAAIRKLRGRS